MKKYFLLALLLTPLFGFDSCQRDSANSKLAVKQEAIMQEADRQSGMPAIHNFTERKFMKMILELRDDPKLICYAYIIPEVTGKPLLLGKCVGYGLPYATQYTNPEVDIYSSTNSSTHHNLPQADPNGLFMPKAAEATWILLINPKTNEPQPVYVEQRLLITPFLLEL